jgi:hypothetical protein
VADEISNSLALWTIYDHPRDYPNHFVARKFVVGASGSMVVTSEVIVADEANALRQIMLKRGLTCLSRDPRDDPKILETWI